MILYKVRSRWGPVSLISSSSSVSWAASDAPETKYSAGQRVKELMELISGRFWEYLALISGNLWWTVLVTNSCRHVCSVLGKSTGLLADNIWIMCSETAWWRGIWIAPKILRSWDPTIVRAWDYFDSHVSRFPIVDLSKDMWKDFEFPAVNPRVVISNYFKNHGQQETPIMSTYIKCTRSMGSEKPITSFSRHFVVDPLTSSYFLGNLLTIPISQLNFG